VALLAIDVGNTQTVFGLFDGTKLQEHWRIATERSRSGDELGALYGNFLDFSSVEGIALASTVPQLHRAYEELAKDYARAELLELGPGVKTGVPIRYEDPREVGPDRIANAVAAVDRYGPPCIVVDFGTSTNFDVVSTEGEYVGGVLAPGIEVSMDALFQRAARLFKVDFVEPPTVIAKNTASTGSPARSTESWSGSAASWARRRRPWRRAGSPT
jgi:type III pantothenate kinase